MFYGRMTFFTWVGKNPMKTISLQHISTVLYYSVLICVSSLSVAQVDSSADEKVMLASEQENKPAIAEYKVVIPKELSKIGIYNGMPYNLARETFQQKNWAFLQDESLDYDDSEYTEIGCERTEANRCLIIVQQNNKTFELFLNKGSTLFYLDGERVPSGREKPRD